MTPELNKLERFPLPNIFRREKLGLKVMLDPTQMVYQSAIRLLALTGIAKLEHFSLPNNFR